MKFPVETLKCKGGVIYSHVFENSYTRIQRDQFWSVEFDFEPLVVDGSEWSVAALIEWLRFPGSRCEILSQHEITFEAEDPMVEASFYFVEHETPKYTKLVLNHIAQDRVHAKLHMGIDFPAHLDFEETPGMQLTLDTTLEYTGFLVVPANLEPVPTTEAEVVDIASRYIDLASHQPPVYDKFRYVFRPKKPESN